MIDASIELVEGRRAARYRIQREGGALSFASVIGCWQNDDGFREDFSSLLADAPFQAFRWETPALTNDRQELPFEFVLTDASSFVSRRTDQQTFASYFTEDAHDQGVVSFPSLGRDCTLIVPSPRAEKSAYGHLAAFVRSAPREQVNAIWRVLGREVAARISSIPMWINTACGGVAWLHVRIDSRPKYYHWKEYKDPHYEPAF
ncbi:MAG: hypothetical protein KDA96_09875 [Planctomycetaceae bacterium]|nr:hypothetical protein [Planctomycetaceae bacterium]